jgi:hypothetical protein
MGNNTFESLSHIHMGLLFSCPQLADTQLPIHWSPQYSNCTVWLSHVLIDTLKTHSGIVDFMQGYLYYRVGKLGYTTVGAGRPHPKSPTSFTHILALVNSLDHVMEPACLFLVKYPFHLSLGPLPARKH